MSNKHRAEPSIAVPDSISHNAELSPSSILVWIGMNHITEIALKHCVPGEVPSLSVPAVAAWIHCSVATVEYGMMELERVGAITAETPTFRCRLHATLKLERKKP